MPKKHKPKTFRAKSAPRKAAPGMAIAKKIERLTTYGWAFLLILLVIGILFALGIFNINNFLGSKAMGFTWFD